MIEVYVRVSSGEQNTGAQERALRDYVQRRGGNVSAVEKQAGQLSSSQQTTSIYVVARLALVRLKNLLADLRRWYCYDPGVALKFGRSVRPSLPAAPHSTD